MKNAIHNLIEITLNLLIALGNIVILTILILPVHKHGVSFHLFVSSSVSFISILQFLEYRCFVSLSRFTPTYFILFEAQNGLKT